jgi:hypothetical protein
MPRKSRIVNIEKNQEKYSGLKPMRKFLYSKWFFGFLAFVCILDLLTDVVADLSEMIHLHEVTIVLELIAVFLSLSMFLDLHNRVKNYGPDSRNR